MIFYENTSILFKFKMEMRDLHLSIVLNTDPGGLYPVCSLSLASDSDLLLCEMSSLAALHMWAANERRVCSPLHHNLLFIKEIYFLPPLYLFTGLQTLTECLSLCSLMMIYEGYPEDVVRSGDVLWALTWVVSCGE